MSTNQLEFKVAGNTYRTTRLSVLNQLHLSRRISPFLTTFMENNGTDLTNMTDVQAINSALKALNSMADEDLDYIVNLCLKSCERSSGGRGHTVWQSVMLADGSPMFEDLDFMDTLQLVAQVIQFNLKSMFAKAVALPTPVPQQSTTE